MKKIAVILTAAMILTLAGCAGGGAETKPATTAGTKTASTSAATTKPAPTPDIDRTYNALVDIDAMQVDGDADALAGGKAEEIIKALDVPIFTTVFSVIGGESDFTADFGKAANNEHFWIVMFDALTHNVTDESIKNTGTQYEIPEEVVLAYAQAWYCGFPSKLPDVAQSLGAGVSYDAARKLYVFEMGDGIYPAVKVTGVRADRNDAAGDVLTLTIDTVYGLDEDELPVEVQLGKGGDPDVGWAVYSVSVAAAGDNNSGYYENSEYGFSIEIPEGFELSENDEGISLYAADANLDIFWQSADKGGTFDAYEYEREFYGYHIMYDYCDENYYTILMELEDGQSGGPSSMYAVYSCMSGELMMRMVFEYSFSEHEKYFPLFQFMCGELGGPAIEDEAITAADAAVAQSLA